MKGLVDLNGRALLNVVGTVRIVDIAPRLVTADPQNE